MNVDLQIDTQAKHTGAYVWEPLSHRHSAMWTLATAVPQGNESEKKALMFPAHGACLAPFLSYLHSSQSFLFAFASRPETPDGIYADERGVTGPRLAVKNRRSPSNAPACCTYFFRPPVTLRRCLSSRRAILWPFMALPDYNVADQRGRRNALEEELSRRKTRRHCVSCASIAKRKRLPFVFRSSLSSFPAASSSSEHELRCPRCCWMSQDVVGAPTPDCEHLHRQQPA